MKERKRVLFAIICFLLVSVFCILFFSRCSCADDTQDDHKSNGIKWDGSSQLTVTNSNPKYVSIPGFSELSFNLKSDTQNVNIYNPENNKCYMNFRMVLADGTLLWKEDNVYPGYGFHKIKIKNQIDKGEYKANLIIKCFDIKTNSEVNGGIVQFKLYIQ